MSDHQPGIFAEGTNHHIFLEFNWRGGERAPGRALAEQPVPGGQQVIGLGPMLSGGVAPVFQAVSGGGSHAPATQQGLFVWLHGEARDELFARALAWRDALASVADVAYEHHGFRYRGGRDLTGFKVGAANPKGKDRMATALIADGDHAGGSYLHAQHWAHDLAKFNALSVADQEAVFGRRKESDELMGDRAEDSHVTRTRLAGNEIYRRSVPVGDTGNPGFYVLAFSADAGRYDALLKSMYGGGSHDRMLAYTKATSGSYYYAPPKGALLAALD